MPPGVHEQNDIVFYPDLAGILDLAMRSLVEFQ